jgi:hypothetical protein
MPWLRLPLTCPLALPLHHRKEALWPHVPEFAQRAIAHIRGMQHTLSAAGEPVELYNVHGHYADAAEAAALISRVLGCDMVATGHSLGRNKLEHLLKSGGGQWSGTCCCTATSVSSCTAAPADSLVGCFISLSSPTPASAAPRSLVPC